MKKTISILGGLAVVLVLSIIGVAYWMAGVNEDERNKKQTEPARNARWRDKKTTIEEEVKEEVKPETKKTDEKENANAL